MTDSEMVQLCGKVMEIEMCERHSHYWPHYFDGSIGEWGEDVKYDPLHDDAQAMALVKKFRLTVATERGSSRWMVGPPPHQYESADTDLNRAICECVAKMHKAHANA